MKEKRSCLNESRIVNDHSTVFVFLIQNERVWLLFFDVSDKEREKKNELLFLCLLSFYLSDRSTQYHANCDRLSGGINLLTWWKMSNFDTKTTIWIHALRADHEFSLTLFTLTTDHVSSLSLSTKQSSRQWRIDLSSFICVCWKLIFKSPRVPFVKSFAKFIWYSCQTAEAENIIYLLKMQIVKASLVRLFFSCPSNFMCWVFMKLWREYRWHK